MGGFRFVLLGGLIVVCAACIGFVFLAEGNLQQADEVNQLMKESHQTQKSIESVMKSTFEMEAAHRGYVITKDKDVQAGFTTAKEHLYANLESCKELSDDAPEQQARVSRLDSLITLRLMLLDSVEELTNLDSGYYANIQELLILGDDIMDDLRILVNEMTSHEMSQLEAKETEIADNIDKARKMTTLFGILTVLITIIGYFLIRKENISKAKLFKEKEAAFDIIESSELRYRNMINSTEDTICITDHKGQILLWNEAGQEMFGHDESDLINTPLKDLIFATAIEDNSELISEDTDKNLFNSMEKEIWNGHRKDGSKFRVEISRSTWYQNDQQLFAFNIRDITERVESRNKQKELLAEVSRSNEDLEQFAYVASHDLQEPLRKIRAFGDRLRDVCSAELSERGKVYVERMQDGAERMQKLIQDLLSFSRVSRNAGNLEDVDLNKVLDQVLSDYSLNIEETNTTVDSEELPVLKQANATQMHQLIQNLVSNAIKFRDESRSPHIQIKVSKSKGKKLNLANPVRPNQKYHVIEVADNGIGFNQKYIDKIFTIFQRLHGRNEYEGTGIGLAVCRKICENHGGFLDAQGVPGEGAKFKIILPTN